MRELSANNRLSVPRVDRCSIQNEWTDRLRSLAAGVPICTAAAFRPSSTPPPMRSKYVRVASAVNKLAYEQYEKGNVLILPTEIVKQIPGVHFSSTHWVKQFFKEMGRMLADATNGDSPLNDAEAKQIIDEVFGLIGHPTVEDLIQMVLRMAKRDGWDHIVLWKKDLKGAFTLLNVLPADVAKCAYELTDGVTMLYMTGFFGWSGFPAAFHNVTKVLSQETQAAITGEMEMYVDDECGCSNLVTAEADMQTANETAWALLGEGCVHPSKDVLGRVVVFIGWEFNLDRRCISIARPNLLKCIHGFYAVDLAKKVQVRTIMKLGSWASRYGLVCRYLKPLSSILYGEVVGITNVNIFKWIGVPAQICIHVWRSILCLLACRPDQFARPLAEFDAQRGVQFQIEYDASLQGFGCIISRKASSNWQVWKVLGTKFPCALPSSSYQNSAEFIGIVMSLGIIASAGGRDAAISVIGDSTASLSWSANEQFQRGPSDKASIVFVQLMAHYNFQIIDTHWIKSEDNYQCDRMSRGVPARALGFPQSSVVDSESASVQRLLGLCNPMLNIYESLDSFRFFWTDVASVVGTLSS